MNGFDISTATAIYLGDTMISAMYYESTKLWPLYDSEYLTFEVVDAGTITVKTVRPGSGGWTIQYSSDDGQTWSSITSSSTEQALGTYSIGDKIKVKGNGIGDTAFGGTAKTNVYGNAMSLLRGDNFVGQTTITENFAFVYLFAGYTNLISAKNMVLPATTLDTHCYEYMFSGCTSLVDAPKLPATNLETNCYAGMFLGCSSLTKAPKLPATTLATGCYSSMFTGCSSLTTAPELPATTLVYACYESMFYGCTSLTKAPELPATTLVNACYYGMFDGCTSLNYIKCMATDISATSCTTNWVRNVAATGLFVKDTNMTSWTTGDNGIPTGWSTSALPTPFSFNYNAKNYNATTYTLYKEDGQLVDYDAVITGNNLQNITYNTTYISIGNVSSMAAIIPGTWNQYIERSAAASEFTIIAKTRTTSGENIFANRRTYNNYNYMLRPKLSQLAFHGQSAVGTLNINNSNPVIYSARVDSNLKLRLDNWTEGTYQDNLSYAWGPANTGQTSCLFNGISDLLTEQWKGDFYWIYLAQKTLTDAEVQQVIDYNENL